MQLAGFIERIKDNVPVLIAFILGVILALAAVSNATRIPPKNLNTSDGRASSAKHGAVDDTTAQLYEEQDIGESNHEVVKPPSVAQKPSSNSPPRTAAPVGAAAHGSVEDARTTSLQLRETAQKSLTAVAAPEPEAEPMALVPGGQEQPTGERSNGFEAGYSILHTRAAGVGKQPQRSPGQSAGQLKPTVRSGSRARGQPSPTEAADIDVDGLKRIKPGMQPFWEEGVIRFISDRFGFIIRGADTLGEPPAPAPRQASGREARAARSGTRIPRQGTGEATSEQLLYAADSDIIAAAEAEAGVAQHPVSKGSDGNSGHAMRHVQQQQQQSLYFSIADLHDRAVTLHRGDRVRYMIIPPAAPATTSDGGDRSGRSRTSSTVSSTSHRVQPAEIDLYFHGHWVRPHPNKPKAIDVMLILSSSDRSAAEKGEEYAGYRHPATTGAGDGSDAAGAMGEAEWHVVSSRGQQQRAKAASRKEPQKKGRQEQRQQRASSSMAHDADIVEETWPALPAHRDNRQQQLRQLPSSIEQSRQPMSYVPGYLGYQDSVEYGGTQRGHALPPQQYPLGFLPSAPITSIEQMPVLTLDSLTPLSQSPSLHTLQSQIAAGGGFRTSGRYLQQESATNNILQPYQQQQAQTTRQQPAALAGMRSLTSTHMGPGAGQSSGQTVAQDLSSSLWGETPLAPGAWTPDVTGSGGRAAAVPLSMATSGSPAEQPRLNLTLPTQLNSGSTTTGPQLLHSAAQVQNNVYSDDNSPLRPEYTRGHDQARLPFASPQHGNEHQGSNGNGTANASKGTAGQPRQVRSGSDEQDSQQYSPDFQGSEQGASKASPQQPKREQQGQQPRQQGHAQHSGQPQQAQ